jgi:hypothetical protein
LLDPEHLLHRPRVGVEGRPQRVLIGGLDGQQRDVLLVIAGDRPAEDDDPLVDEPVGEHGMLVKEGLLADAAGVVPVRALGRGDREYRHRSSARRDV